MISCADVGMIKEFLINAGDWHICTGAVNLKASVAIIIINFTHNNFTQTMSGNKHGNIVLWRSYPSGAFVDDKSAPVTVTAQINDRFLETVPWTCDKPLLAQHAAGNPQQKSAIAKIRHHNAQVFARLKERAPADSNMSSGSPSGAKHNGNGGGSNGKKSAYSSGRRPNLTGAMNPNQRTAYANT